MRRALLLVNPSSRRGREAKPKAAEILRQGFELIQPSEENPANFAEIIGRFADKVDVVILGCTHYPLVRPLLQRILGRGVTLVSAGAAVARRVESALEGRGLATTATGEGDYRFLCTGDPAAFAALGTRFLQLPLGEVTHVEVTPTREFRIGVPA